MRRFAIKRLLAPTNLRIVLFTLCGMLAIAAAVLLYVQWNEGRTAARNAEALLDASGIKPSVTALESVPGTQSTDAVSESVPSTQTLANIAASMPPPELQGYKIIARLDIDALDLHLPVLYEASDKALKVSVCYYEGPLPDEEGNLVITGHNYHNGAHFGRLDKLKTGDTVFVTGTDGKTYAYAVYKLEHIRPDDAQALGDTEYDRELSLLTCESSGNGRLLVRCRMDDE